MLEYTPILPANVTLVAMSGTESLGTDGPYGAFTLHGTGTGNGSGTGKMAFYILCRNVHTAWKGDRNWCRVPE